MEDYGSGLVQGNISALKNYLEKLEASEKIGKEELGIGNLKNLKLSWRYKRFI